MIKSQDLENRLLALEAKLSERKYFVTALLGSLLKRDLNNDDIEVIDASSPEYDDLCLQSKQFILSDLLGLDDWSECESNLEKVFLLEQMHPGLSARQAWRRESKAINDSIPKYVEPKHVTSNDEGVSPNDDKPESKPIMETELQQRQRIDKINQLIAIDFPEEGGVSLF